MPAKKKEPAAAPVKAKRTPTKWKANTGTLLVGSCLDRLKDLDNASIDSIVTDPPYELGFMGNRWDASGIAYSVELWQECLRVLKPGGYLLAFGGTRTYHRMACAIEDAGFEIRDSINWVYGSGFPKSLDVSKAIDKQRHDRAEIYEVTAWIRAARDAAGLSNRDIDDAFGFSGMAGHWTSSKSQPAVPTLEQVPDLLDVLGVTLDEIPARVRDLLWTLNSPKGQPGPNWAKRPKIGSDTKARSTSGKSALPTLNGRTVYETWDITAPATDLAKEWAGWGTALKPAHEPIVLARKPLIGTVAANVLGHGTGALNIDGCRVTSSGEVTTLGRWPANIIFDEAAGIELDAQSGFAASRFFYCAKPSKKERNEGLEALPTSRPDKWTTSAMGTFEAKGVQPQKNHHPTVKPVALMAWLIRLVTPPGGVVLDPFMGSGTTAVAAVREGFTWLGCELTAEYLAIIKGRVKHAEKEKAAQPATLFDN